MGAEGNLFMLKTFLFEKIRFYKFFRFRVGQYRPRFRGVAAFSRSPSSSKRDFSFDSELSCSIFLKIRFVERWSVNATGHLYGTVKFEDHAYYCEL